MRRRADDTPLSAPDHSVIEQTGATPTVEVRVYRDGDLIHRELVETEEEAAAIVEAWTEMGGVECEVDDLSARHGPDSILEPRIAPERFEERAHEERGDEPDQEW